MKKTIRSKTYDTSAAEELGFRYVGRFGDPAGFEEHLYRTSEGFCFLYGIGGTESPYNTEKIRPVSAKNAALWLETHGQNR